MRYIMGEIKRAAMDNTNGKMKKDDGFINWVRGSWDSVVITRRLTTSNKGKCLRWGCTCVCSRWQPPTISTLKPSFHHQHPVPKLTIIRQALLLYHTQRYPNTASEPPYPASTSMTSPIILPYPCLHHPST